jgi:hypothetical protein
VSPRSGTRDLGAARESWRARRGRLFTHPADFVGIFQNDETIHGLVGPILLDQNDEWKVQRSRHMSLETVASLCDDRPVSLSALAN